MTELRIALSCPEPLVERITGWCAELGAMAVSYVIDDAAATQARAAGYVVLHAEAVDLRQLRGPLTTNALRAEIGDWHVHCADVDPASRARVAVVLGEIVDDDRYQPRRF